MEGKEEKVTVEPVEEVTVPTMTDDDPALEMNTKEIWVDGKKYTADIIRKMVEDGVKEHRVFIELDQAYDEACSEIKELEAINADLITKAPELKDKYEELRGQLSRKEASSLENMTIGDAVKYYRALKRILRDEVLQ